MRKESCLPAGSGGSSGSRFSASRCVAHGAMPSALRMSSSRRLPDLARVDRSRCARRTVRRSGETRRRAHFFSYSLAACGLMSPASLRAAGLFDASVPELPSAASTFHLADNRASDGPCWPPACSRKRCQRFERGMMWEWMKRSASDAISRSRIRDQIKNFVKAARVAMQPGARSIRGTRSGAVRAGRACHLRFAFFWKV
jgi:hypothetical protein